MLKRLCILLILMIAVFTMMPAVARAAPQAPDISSQVAVLMDQVTGEVIYAKNETEQWEPASLTKIMTMYLALEAINNGSLSLDEMITVSERAWRTGGSRMYIEVDTQVSVADLLKGISIVSGNDASVAVAERLGGSVEGFAARMNEKAKHLGLTDTNFTNPHGLPDEEHYTTGLDIARLARAYINDFPQALEYHSTREYTFNNITQQNRNGLLKYPEIDGLKTGFLSSTCNLIATGKRDDYRLIAVIMGAASETAREQDALALLNFGFDNYAASQIGKAGQSFGEIPVYKGKRGRVKAVLPADLTVTVYKNAEVKVNTDLPAYLEAPLAKGQQIGSLVIEAREQQKSYPLVAAEEIRRGNFLKVIWHNLLLGIKKLLGMI
ncbi:MAG: D-alanyl-D-alanine carboxypeptidase [Clostridia bacterium]|nr:D-alanyl-D-alanine carboxypeptidase [Clostridia bacterium]